MNPVHQQKARWLLVLTGALCLATACHRDADEFSQIGRFNLKVATSYLNDDGLGRLAISWAVYDQAGQEVPPLQSAPQVYADGVLLTNPSYYATTKPGVHFLEARLGPLTSPPLSLTARSSQTYPLVRLPIVFHIAKHLTALITAQQVQQTLDAVNALYRNQRANPDPNNADSFIEFYPATRDPNGQALSGPGIHPLDFNDPATDEQARTKVDSILQSWCVKQYINVFMDIDWEKDRYHGWYNYSYQPFYPTGAYPGDPSCATKPAVRAAIRSGLQPDVVAHELGHFLGLSHTFGACTGRLADAHVLDTPQQEEARPDAAGQKVSCNQVSFAATNVMDYYNNRMGFTRDQVGVMRVIIDHPTHLPVKGSSQAGSPHGSQGRSQSPVSIVTCKN